MSREDDSRIYILPLPSRVLFLQILEALMVLCTTAHTYESERVG
jgi:hypothetical protein